MSDRNAKDNVDSVDGREILARLVAVAVATWNCVSQDPSTRHIGPMARDFAAAFKVGQDERHISTADADGVALAAIQGLYQMVQERDARLDVLQQQNTTRQAQLAALQQQITGLEARLVALDRKLGGHRRANGAAGLRPARWGAAAGWIGAGRLTMRPRLRSR